LGAIGYPIEHSLSPAMHNAALSQMGLQDEYTYIRVSIAPETIARSATIEEAIADFGNVETVVGFNVTIPHKQAIVPLLSQVSDLAQAVGAVNSVWRTEAGWVGDNTDVAGFIAPLKELDRDWKTCNAVILGNGGAARAVVAGLAQLGCPQIRVLGRNAQNLQAFAQSWTNSPLSSRLEVRLLDELPEVLPNTHLLVNSTPIGMGKDRDRSPVSAQLLQGLPDGAIAYDLIYNPRPTRFLAEAAARGLIAIDGSQMLVQQGAAALGRWLQQQGIDRIVPVDVMRQALLEALSNP
jgi:shikimate dehydrogenase